MARAGRRAYAMAATATAVRKPEQISREMLKRQSTPSFEKVLSSIGNTPLVKIDTGMFAKLEGHNPGQSIKDRALSSMVLAMLADGRLDPDADSLCLVTSGSAGISLLSLHKALRSAGLQMDVVIVVPQAYAHKPVPSEILATPGVQIYRSGEALKAAAGTTCGAQKVLLLEGTFMEVMAEAKEFAAEADWRVLDQHYDDNGLLAHEATVRELLRDCPGVTDVVCTTGTGATAAGLRRFLPEHIRVHARPGISGTIDGLSDVNRYGNFCDTEQLEGYGECCFDPDQANLHTEELESVYGIRAGGSSGAAFWLAKELIQADANAKICFICADGTMDLAHREQAHKLQEHRSLSSAAVPKYAADEDGLLLTCSGCGTSVNGASNATFRCPNCDKQPRADHVLAPSSDVTSALEILVKSSSATTPAADETRNPFVDFRHLLYSHRVAMSRGMSDADYVEMAAHLNQSLEDVDGSGFTETPLLFSEELNCFLKNETGNVGQSHKARHLNNVMLYLLALRATGMDELADRRLAVASCGNAGLAAATIAAAAGWPIDVCIPPTASPAVQTRLQELGASVVVCERGVGVVDTALGSISTEGAADPTLAVCRTLVAEHGSIPFSVQGPECGLAVEGGQTLGFEIAQQLARQNPTVDAIRSVFVQVGGGALGAGLSQAFARAEEAGLGSSLSNTEFHCVQPQGNQPLHRAYSRLTDRQLTAKAAAKQRDEFMTPWADPQSVAFGILDDETYDWVALCQAMQSSGGASHVVQDETICEAKEIAEAMGVPVCHTGAAGLAGMLEHRRRQGTDNSAPDLVVLSGLDREMA